ncbi:MAG: efflux RND transporter periplasmic adaptor subunit [Rhodothermales bacterium]|nr:efflux RND transporter periplasmic adaptor subunit [Rhodothermales bacterium]
MKRKLLLPGLAVAAIVLTTASFFLGRQTAQNASLESHTQIDERQILYWQAPMNPTEIYDSPGKSSMGMDLVPVYANDEASVDDSSDERAIAYWRAPMDPTEIYDNPGKSRMGMDLIPVYADGESLGSGGTISIDPAMVQNMGLKSDLVQRLDFSRTIRTVGEVKYDEEKMFVISSKISGWIEKLHVNFVGEEIRAGDAVLEIYSPELVSTQKEYLLALKAFQRAQSSGKESTIRDAESFLKSSKQRLLLWDIGQEEIDLLEQSGEVFKTVVIRSPGVGIVISKNATEGAHIRVGANLFEVADLRTVWVHASFYENEAPWIREGQPVEMELSYLPGKTYNGRVSYVYPFLREEARDVHVRLVFSNPDLDLKPGMYANVLLEGKTIPGAIVVPTESIIRSGARSIAFVVRGEGKFEPRELKIGELGGPGNRFAHVLSGLLEGEEIVTSAQFMLDSESRLQEALQKILGDQSVTVTSISDEANVDPIEINSDDFPESTASDSAATQNHNHDS